LLLGALCVIVAISRWYALSTSQFDWDESLFAAGVQKYDVTAQHPHPPGYPLFILFAKIVGLAVHDNFRSLQAVVAVASFLLFPATFFLLRELRFRFRIAITGAVITAFLPTVWYYGGTALSDIPALCAVVLASALLLAGSRNPRAWIAGMFVAGIAGGIRPLHVVIAVVPAVVGAAALRRPRVILSEGNSVNAAEAVMTRPSPAASRHPLPASRGEGSQMRTFAPRSGEKVAGGRMRGRVISIGCAVFAVVVAASYIGAALATPRPPWGYLHEIDVTARYIGSTDSFNNVTRPPLGKLAATFFVDSHRGGKAGVALLALAAIGLAEGTIRRRVNIGIILAMFVPIAIVSWMMLDLTAVTRYGVAYAMLYSLAGAYGIDVLARALKNKTAQSAITTAAATILVAAFIGWTRPALAVVRHHASPPIAAMRWIRTRLPPVGPHLYVDSNLGFHAEYELPGYDVHGFETYDQIPAVAYVAGNYCLVDRLTIQPHVRYFSFPRDHLEQIARDVYFETSVIPMDAMIRFGEGWYQDENDPGRTRAWRWMRESSTTLFPPIGSNGVLRLRFHLPLDALPRPAKLTIIWNGTVIEQSFCKDLDNDRQFVVTSRTDAPNECHIFVDETAHARGDPRDLGLELYGVSWERTRL